MKDVYNSSVDETVDVDFIIPVFIYFFSFFIYVVSMYAIQIEGVESFEVNVIRLCTHVIIIIIFFLINQLNLFVQPKQRKKQFIINLVILLFFQMVLYFTGTPIELLVIFVYILQMIHPLLIRKL